ncbi:MAG: hypothetical protein ACXVAS_11225 [Vulcanimicrobiaceae bacterium]
MQSDDPFAEVPDHVARRDDFAATSALRKLRAEKLDALPLRSSVAAARLSGTAPVDDPVLFNAATMSDYYRLSVEERLAQSLEALRRMPPQTRWEIRQVTIMLAAIRFGLAGRFDDGIAFIRAQEQRLASNPEREPFFVMLRAIVDGAADRIIDVEVIRTQVAPLLEEGHHRGLFARGVGAPFALANGDWDSARRELEIAYDQERRSDRPTYLAELLMTMAFEAWRYGDERSLTQWHEQLLSLDDPAVAEGTALFRAALDGSAIAQMQSGVESSQIVFAAFTIAASHEPDRTLALSLARRALKAAYATNQPTKIALALVALSILDPDSREKHIRDAILQARRTTSRNLKSALKSLLRNEGELGPLQMFVAHFDPHTRGHERLRIAMIGGVRVMWDNRPVTLENKPLQVLLHLALKGAPMRGVEIAAALWPEKNPSSMMSALRVHIAAVRKALEKDAILFQNGTYTLGCAVEIDVRTAYRRIENIENGRRIRRHDRAYVEALSTGLQSMAADGVSSEVLASIAADITHLRVVTDRLLGRGDAAKRSSWE